MAKDNIQIPKIIHQIWIGEAEMPQHCKDFVEEMKRLHPDWEHYLWGNEVFTERYPDDPFLQNYIKDPELYKWAFISDRVRMLLLRDMGGIYCDVDARPVKSFNTVRDQLTPEHTFLSGLKPSQNNNTLLDCTVYGSAPNSRIVEECLSCYDRITWAHGCKTFSDKIIQKMGPDVALFGYQYFYNWEIDEKTVVLHDVLESRLFSWVDEEDKVKGALEW
tara:strand:+ start:1585 stop:2241 length:657 start_codon:yes stop_codon:yes gene_type:complete